jgi:hypothetical protein
MKKWGLPFHFQIGFYFVRFQILVSVYTELSPPPTQCSMIIAEHLYTWVAQAYFYFGYEF